MYRSQGSLVFNQPIEEVFASFSRPDYFAGFMQYGEVHPLSEGPVRAGTRIRYTGKGGVRWLKSTAEVISYEPPRRLSVRDEASGCISGTAIYSYELEPVEERTNVTLTMEVRYKGWARLLFLLFSRSQFLREQMNRSAQMRLSQLKKKLEAPLDETLMPDLDAQLIAQQVGAGAQAAPRSTRKRPLWSLLRQMQPLDLIRQPTKSPGWRVPLIALFLLATLVLCGFTIKDFWGDWQDGQWDNVSFYQLGLIWLALIGTWGGGWLGYQGMWRALAAQTVRRFAIAGDERVAPLAITQPPAQAETYLAQLTEGLRLKRPTDPQRQLERLWPLAFLPLALIPFIFFANLLSTTFAIAAGSILALACIAAVMLFWRWHLPLVVQADDLGVHWNERHWWGNREQTIVWSQAGAFFTFTFKPTTLFSSPHSIYALESPTAILAWEGPPRAKREQSEAHDSLCSLIARHTHLPLRDVSECIQIRMHQGVRSIMTSMLRFADISVPLPRRTWRQFALQGIWMIPLLLVGLSYGASWGLSRYERSYYGNLLAQIERHQPLYHNSLATPDGDWPIQMPTADDNTSYTYSNGMYQLSGGPDGASITVWPQKIVSYGDAAVEVTVRLLSGSQYDDVGLMLHSNGNSAMIVFHIDLSGFWEVEHDDPGSNVLGSVNNIADSGLIHSSLGAANRLAVIMRGDQYICFINSQFVGILQDNSRPTGLVGLYVGSTAATAAFSDFIIYPI